MKALFIHRSVGRNLIVEGRLRELLRAHNATLDDYDNNTGILATSGANSSGTIAIPGNNTNPDNLAHYFMNWDTLLDDYELIVIKSCYPNSRIKDEAQFAAVRQAYQTIFAAFASRRKHLALLTSPPLRPLFTNKREAGLARKLSEWLVGSAGEYVYVLDFRALLAEPGGRHAGMLAREYRRLLPFDNHPNKKANQDIAPVVAHFLSDNNTMYSQKDSTNE